MWTGRFSFCRDILPAFDGTGVHREAHQEAHLPFARNTSHRIVSTLWRGTRSEKVCVVAMQLATSLDASWRRSDSICIHAPHSIRAIICR